VEKIIVLKNDRVGDLFVSLSAINLILNKHQDKEIHIYLSKLNYKFNFLFKNIQTKILNYDLNLLEKIQIIIFLLLNKVSTVYILTPKKFYYYLPFFFRKIKFYGICINSKKSRPSNFLRKYLYKKEIINRLNIKKRLSSYEVQKRLIGFDKNVKNFLSKDIINGRKLELPKVSTFFHYKHKLFSELLAWDYKKIKDFLYFISSKRENIIFSSEINKKETDDFFYKNFNSIDFKTNKYNKINEKNILFLKNIDGKNLFKAIYHSKDIIAPEGIISHIGYFLNKNILALMHFRLKNREDFINQIISCKEWFPPDNFKYIVLKKDFSKSLKKLAKRI